jgi:hypothetical protein
MLKIFLRRSEDAASRNRFPEAAAIFLALFLLMGGLHTPYAARNVSKASLEGSKASQHLQSDGETAIPFMPGERLRYRVYWLGLPVGWAELSVRDGGMKKGKPLLHFRSVARSTGVFSLIFRVDDQVDSFFDKEGLRSVSYRIRQEEGHYKSRKRIDFYHSLGKAVYIKNREKPRVYDLIPGAQDPLSSLYFLRTQEIEAGMRLKVQSFVRRRNTEIDVDVLKMEVLETDFGPLKAYLLSPSSEYEGIFKKSGRIRVWLSADGLKVPLRMESKIIVGAITAVLEEVDEETAKVFPAQR